MNSILENIFMSTELYQTVLNPVCSKYNVTHNELIVLLFLANNPEYDTATDIVAKRRLTKSSVSMAGRTLQERGLITGEYADGNHRSVHLRVCKSAEDIIRDGQAAQDTFFQIITEDFTEEEKAMFKSYMTRVTNNISGYHKKMKQMSK